MLTKQKTMIDDHYQLATNPETAPEILRELSQSDDRAIRQAVAGNPNVPINILQKLHQEFPSEILVNPAFIGLTVAAQVSLASNPETNPESLRELSYHSDPEIAGSVAQNPNTPIDVLQSLDQLLSPSGFVKSNPTNDIIGRSLLALPFLE